MRNTGFEKWSGVLGNDSIFCCEGLRLWKHFVGSRNLRSKALCRRVVCVHAFSSGCGDEMSQTLESSGTKGEIPDAWANSRKWIPRRLSGRRDGWRRSLGWDSANCSFILKHMILPGQKVFTKLHGPAHTAGVLASSGEFKSRGLTK